MHILILAQTDGAAEELRTALADSADHHTLVTTWQEALAYIEDTPPDLILVERAALAKMEPATLLTLVEPGRWPPMILLDTPGVDARDRAALTQHLIPTSPPFYQVGGLRIDTRKKRVGLGDRWTTLPPLQYRLLLTLAQRADEVVSYRELLQAVWGYEGEDNEARELLKVHIRQIRRRLRLDPEEHYIRSVRGFGYMLTSPEEE